MKTKWMLSERVIIEESCLEKGLFSIIIIFGFPALLFFPFLRNKETGNISSAPHGLNWETFTSYRKNGRLAQNFLP
jgi:hypothetical protein